MSALSDSPQPPHDVARPSRWRRVLLWTLSALAALLLVLVIAVAALLHSQRLHEYLLTSVQQNASESLGVSVQLQNFAIHFSGINPTVDIYGLVVHGAAPYADPPLLRVEHARIGIRIESLVRRRWYLGEVTVHHAVGQLHVDANGNTNLPAPKQSSNQNGVQTLFDLAIRHAVLDQGEFYYNDSKRSLRADMRNVMLNAGFNSSRELYTGQLGYSDGSFKSADYQPIPHALHLQFEMTPSHLDLRNAELRSGSSAVRFSATVDDFNNPRIAAIYHASIDATDLRGLLRNPQLPLGLLQLDGHAEYAIKANQPPLNALTINGTLRSARIELRASGVCTEARSIQATYSLANGDAEIGSLKAALLGGTLDARATVKNLAGEQIGAVHVKTDGISLADLKQLAMTFRAPAAGAASVAAYPAAKLDNHAPAAGSAAIPNHAGSVTLAGTMQASGDAVWKGSLQNLTATADATINAQTGSTESTSTVPLTGEIHAGYRNRDRQLTLRDSYLHTAQTSLMLNGDLNSTARGERSQMNVVLNAQDLHELETIAAIFRKPAQQLGLYGNAQFTGTLTGSASAPRLAGDLSAQNLRLRGTAWKLLHAHLDADASDVAIQGGRLVPAVAPGAPQGNIAFSGHAQLKKWLFAESSPFQLTLDAQKLDAAQLARLAGFTQPITGTLNANVQLHGTELNPIGDGRVELLRASFAGEAFQSAVVHFNGDGSAAHANANVTMPAGATTVAVTYYPQQRGYEVQMEAHDFHLEQLQAVKAHKLTISGVVNLVASGRGTIDDPELMAHVEIPQLRAQGKTIDHLALQADVAHHAADITLETRALNTNIHGHATVQLTGDYLADAVLDTQPIPLQPLLAAYAPSQAEGVTGETEVHATLRGPLKHRERIEAHIVIPELSAHYNKSMEIAASGPIHADYVNGVLTVERSGLKGTGTDLQFQGSLPLLDRAKPVSLLLLGSVDLGLAQLFDPDVTSSGQLRFNINSYGNRTDPNFKGDVQIVNASFTAADLPVGLSNGNGTLTLTPDRLNITRFEGTIGGGKITARGGMAYHPAFLFDVALSGQGIRMLYPDGVREEASANLTLTGNLAQAVLRGQVNVDQLSFSPDFDLSSLSQFGGGVEEPPSRGFAGNLQLNVSLRSSQSMNPVSRTLSVSGSANLRVTGTAAQPVILGRVNLTGGDLIFQGNRYVLQGGVIDFVNPTRTEPNVNVSVATTIRQYNIGLRFEGPLERLRTSYSSDPALPPADIINLIAFGQTNEAQTAATANGASTTQTAEQSIASAVSSQVTSRVQKIAGISQISIDPSLGNNQSTGTTITVQQRVTSKIYVTFSTDVTSTQREVIQFQYQATPNVGFTSTRDQNGGFGFETQITKQW